MMVLSRMARIGLSPSPRTLVSLIQCFMRLGQVKTADGIFQWMVKNDIKVTCSTYAALLTIPQNATAKESKDLLKRAQKLHEDMGKHDIVPNQHYFASFINICARARDLKAAKSMWNDMMQLIEHDKGLLADSDITNDSALKPDLITYSTMIDAYAKAGDEQGMLQLFNSMVEKGIRLDASLYAAVLRALKKFPDDARRVWIRMIESKVVPDASAYGAYIRCMMDAGRYDAVLQELKTGSSGSVSPAVLYEQAMMHAVRNSSATAAPALHRLIEHITAQMKEERVAYTAGTYAEILKLHAQRQAKTQHWSWLLLPPTFDTYPLMDVFAGEKGGDVTAMNDIVSELLGDSTGSSGSERGDAVDTWSEELLPGTHPSLMTALVGAMAVQGKFDQALTLFRQHQEQSSAFWLAWSMQLLLYGARNSPVAKGPNQDHYVQHDVEGTPPSTCTSTTTTTTTTKAMNESSSQNLMISRVVDVISEARKLSRHACHGWWFDLPTQRAVGKLLRKSSDGDVKNAVLVDGQNNRM